MVWKLKNPILVLFIILLSLGGIFWFKQTFLPLKAAFSLNPEADFYVVGYKNIEGFRLDNDHPTQVSDERVEIVKGQINQVVQRAEIRDRFLVFSEEGPPLGAVGRVISMDFETGNIVYNQTSDYAFTSSGHSPDYYFTSEANSDKGFIAAFDSHLKKTSKYLFEDAVIGSDFSTDSAKLYFLGTKIHGDGNFPIELYQLSMTNGQLALDKSEMLYQVPDITYFFGDTIVKGNHLYSMVSGYRINDSKERIVLGKVFHYDLLSGNKTFFDLQELAPTNIFDLGQDLIAIEHEKADSRKLGFSLFNLQDASTSFIDLSRFGLSIQSNYLKDVKRLDDDRLLILSGNSLIVYSLSKDEAISQETVDLDAFHVWINHSH